MAVNGTTTNENGDAILISLQEPYKNVVEVVSFTDEVEGESTDCFYTKQFRWGTDGVAYSDYVDLTNENLAALLLNPEEPFWIQYKYTQVGDCTLEFKSIALEIVTDGGVICRVPQVECCDSQSMSGAQNLVVDCCESTWNPYDLSRASQMYNQLSSVASQIFGFCVKYFKTQADQRSKDVILKEYSLFDVIDTAEVKLMIPDNAFPTRELQFNPLMIDYPVQFEVHIVKSEFEKVFGAGAKPEMRDYLYFEQYLNKVYEVDAIAEPDDFLYAGSYWRVSLVQYQQRTAVQYPDKNIEAAKDAIVTSVEEEFGEEREKEFKDVRKPKVYNTIGNQNNDYVRRILDKQLIIKQENVYNFYTIISKYHYKLSSMKKGEEAVEYRFTDGWTTEENRAFTGWIRPTYINQIGSNVLITAVSNIGGQAALNTNGLPQPANRKVVAGDFLRITGTKSYNGIQEILSISGNTVILNTPFVDSTINPNAKFRKEGGSRFFVYESNDEEYFSLVQTVEAFIVNINDTKYEFDMPFQFLANNFYSYVINLNNKARQLSLFVYETQINVTQPNAGSTGELKKVYEKTITISPVEVPGGHSWRLLASDVDFTNNRIWNTPIEIEEQNLVLSQYVVNDTSLALLIDNASPRLLVPRTNQPR